MWKEEIKNFYKKFIPLEIILITDMCFLIFYLSNIFSYLSFFYSFFDVSINFSHGNIFLSLLTYIFIIFFIILNKSFKFNIRKNKFRLFFSRTVFIFICFIDIYLFLLFFLRLTVYNYNFLFSIISILCLFLHIDYWNLLNNRDGKK